MNPVTKAVAWRLWRHLRWGCAALFIVLLVGLASDVRYALSHAGTSLRSALLWHVLLPHLYGLYVTGNVPLSALRLHGLPVVSATEALAPLAFAAWTVASERKGGWLAGTLTGPVPRHTAWALTSGLALGIPLAGITVKALLLAAIDAVAGRPLPLTAAGAWWCVNALIGIAAGTAGLFAATGLSDLLAAGLGGAYVCGLPAMVGQVLLGLSGKTHTGTTMVASTSTPIAAHSTAATSALHTSGFPPDPFLVQAGNFLISLSPFSHLSGQTSLVFEDGSGPPGTRTAGAHIPHWPPIGYDTHTHLTLWLVLWFIVWAIAFAWASWRVLAGTPVEQFPHLFVRTAWVYGCAWACAFFAAFCVAQVCAYVFNGPYGLSFALAFLVFASLMHTMAHKTREEVFG